MNVKEAYEDRLDLTGNPVAASILVLADTLQQYRLKDISDSFGHELCMGIRHGLFGSQAESMPSILSLQGLNVEISQQ